MATVTTRASQKDAKEAREFEVNVMVKHRGLLDNDSSTVADDDFGVTAGDIDPDSFREVQVFFNGRFVHEVTVPVRYTESAEAFAEIFTAAAAQMEEKEQAAMMADSRLSPTRLVPIRRCDG